MRQRQARRRASATYRDRVLSSLDVLEEEERRAARREEARDARDEEFHQALILEMRAGRELLREAVDAMRDIAEYARDSQYRSRRWRSRSPRER